jgi:hypothetical protein
MQVTPFVYEISVRKGNRFFSISAMTNTDPIAMEPTPAAAAKERAIVKALALEIVKQL